MFRCEGTLYQFLCLCLGFAAAPYVSIKLLKIPMALLTIQICIVIYLDNMLFIGRTREETTALRDTVILLLQCLGFYKSKNVSSDTSSQKIEFLEMIVNSKEMTTSIPQKKSQSIKQMFQNLYQNPQTTVLRVNPLSTNPTKWSNTLKQFACCWWC